MSNTGFEQTLARDIECYTCGEEPSPLLMLRCPRIEFWSSEVRTVGKAVKLVVHGQTRQPPDSADGEEICMSAVMWFDRKHRWIRTAHRVFELGQPAGF